VIGAEHHGAAESTQFAIGPEDARGLMRDPHALPVGGAIVNHGNSTQNAGAGLRETFSALDSEAAPGALAWTHSSARQAEAGFQDPALGWVGVRADLSGGGVHASLLPDSAAAAQELGRHMDGINTYLAEQHTPVASLGMAAPSGRGSESGAGDGFGQGTQQGMQQGSGQNAQQQNNAELQPESAINRASFSRAPLAQNTGARVDAESSVHETGGAHISVMA
jgi:hypothetical protein